MQSENSGPPQPKQPREFTCAACGLTHSLRGFFAGGVTNKLMEVGEYARLCDGCCARARVSGKSRRRIEQTVRRKCLEGAPGAIERVVILASEVFGGRAA